MQGVFYGAVKALEKQKPALIINSITYYGLVTPFAYIFAFYVPQGWISNNLGLTAVDLDKQKYLEEEGILIGFMIGLTHQILAYWVMLSFADWGKACQNALERQNKEPLSTINTHHSQMSFRSDNQSPDYLTDKEDNSIENFSI